MFKALFLSALLGPCAVAASSLSGTVQDSTKGPIDGAKVTLWDVATGKGFQTISSVGDFTLSNLPKGNYLLKVESAGLTPVYGALRLAGDGAHKINVVMLGVEGNTDAVAAGAALRDAVGLGPPQDPSKAQPPKVKKKVTPDYPCTAMRAGVKGTVRIAAVMLSDGRLGDLVALSAPDKDLAVAALMAVRQWRYFRTRLDGKPVETGFTIDVKFGALEQNPSAGSARHN